MKFLKFFILFLFAAFINVDADAQRNPVFWYPAVDTVTDAGSSTFTLSDNLFRQGSLEIHVVADSLTGATDGTLIIQTSAHSNGSQWTDAQSFTIDGVQTVCRFEDVDFTASRVRVSITQSGTQTTKYQVSGVFKPE